MSFRLPRKLVVDRLEDIKKQVVLKSKSSQYDPIAQIHYCIRNTKKCSYIPLALWSMFYDRFPNTPSKSNFAFKCIQKPYTLETDPKGRRDQDVVLKEAMRQLKEDHVTFLALPTGFGKSFCGTYLASKLRGRTLILCHYSMVRKQWLDEVTRILRIGNKPVKAEMVKGDTLDRDAQIHIMGVIKAGKFNKDEFKDIETVIVDEAHVTTIRLFTEVLLRIQPKYLIGLSATPEREDGMHQVLRIYFNEPIVRTEVKPFTVYKVETGITPVMKTTLVYGKPTLDWNGLVQSLIQNSRRTQQIIDIVMNHPERRILILADRQELCRNVHSLLTENGEKVGKLWGRYNTNLDSRILIAGMKKAGVGFNDPTLDMLVLATSVKNVKQYEGRIRTMNNIIYDLVDRCSVLEKHWRIRKDWYVQRGAMIIEPNHKKEDEVEVPTRDLFSYKA